jgi:hypothetical protein
MKVIYLIGIVFILFLIGCSSTYKVSDFPSKEKFYDDFNKSINNKTAKVILYNDSSFSITGNIKIASDSLSFLNSGKDNIANMPLERVKMIRVKYAGNKTLTGLWIGASFSVLAGLVYILANNQGGGNESPAHISVLPASFGFAGIGGIVGAIIGTFLDKTYVYQFSP